MKMRVLVFFDTFYSCIIHRIFFYLGVEKYPIFFLNVNRVYFYRQ